MSDALVDVVAYDPLWPAEFERESRHIAKALASWLVGPVVHIGSTAVPGLSAKPVIDIMAPVESLPASRPAIVAAQRLGYLYFRYKADLMHWFCKPSPSVRTHHLHLVPSSSPLWQERLAFRDALRVNPKLRVEYQTLKLELASQHRQDREAYTEAKSPFIAKVLHARARGG